MLLMIERTMMAVSGLVAAFCVCCLDTEPLPSWLIPVMVISSGLAILFGVLAEGWVDDDVD